MEISIGRGAGGGAGALVRVGAPELAQAASAAAAKAAVAVTPFECRQDKEFLKRPSFDAGSPASRSAEQFGRNA
jgi:hypothetical protein